MALTTLNNEVFTQAAQAMAHRALSADVASDTERLTLVFRLCVARSPSDTELSDFQRLLDRGRYWFAEHTDEAVQLIGPYQPEGVPADETAAWVATARIIMNLDEFITRE